MESETQIAAAMAVKGAVMITDMDGKLWTGNTFTVGENIGPPIVNVNSNISWWPVPPLPGEYWGIPSWVSGDTITVCFLDGMEITGVFQDDSFQCLYIRQESGELYIPKARVRWVRVHKEALETR